MKRKKLLFVLMTGLIAAGIAAERAEGKKQKAHPTTGTDGLFYAAEHCDVPTIKSLAASGVDIEATNANGLDALSLASQIRSARISKKNPIWTLICTTGVTALTDAGADPWKAKYYQDPRLNDQQPDMIAVISVEDNRKEKGKSEKIMNEMIHGVELQLHGGFGPGKLHLRYPIIPLSEARQKLLAAGFSADDAMAPDRMKACKALGVESVFEASLEDYRSRNVGVAQAAGMRMNFALTDCKTGEPLWRSDLDYALSTGFLISAFGGAKVQETITGSVAGNPAISFPVHPKEK